MKTVLSWLRSIVIDRARWNESEMIINNLLQYSIIKLLLCYANNNRNTVNSVGGASKIGLTVSPIS